MAQIDAIGTPRTAHGPMAHGEDDAVAVAEGYDLDPRLHPRSLLGEHELAAREVRARTRYQDNRLSQGCTAAIAYGVERVGLTCSNE